MSLVGNLEDLGLSDIFQIIFLSRRSGVLAIRGKNVEGKIYFKDGMVIAAYSTDISPAKKMISVSAKDAVFSLFIEEGNFDFELKDPDEEIKEKIKWSVEGEGKMEVLSDIFTTFAEVDAEFDSLESLLFIAFNYMPSHIQITKPENFFIRNEDLDVLLTNIILRLHRYDEIAKRITIEKAILENKLKELTDKKKSYK